MIVAEIIERLSLADGSPFALIEGAAELAAIVDQPLALPAAYVFVKEEASEENTRMAGTLQRTEADIAVAIFAANVSDATGGAAAGDIEALKGFVRGALIGWQPPSATDAIIHVGGQLVRARGGLLVWEMTLGVAFYLEGN